MSSRGRGSSSRCRRSSTSSCQGGAYLTPDERQEIRKQQLPGRRSMGSRYIEEPEQIRKEYVEFIGEWNKDLHKEANERRKNSRLNATLKAEARKHENLNDESPRDVVTAAHKVVKDECMSLKDLISEREKFEEENLHTLPKMSKEENEQLVEQNDIYKKATTLNSDCPFGFMVQAQRNKKAIAYTNKIQRRAIECVKSCWSHIKSKLSKTSRTSNQQ